MPKLKALIFDVDGTLSDTERDGHRVAFNQAFDEAESGLVLGCGNLRSFVKRNRR